MSALLNVVIDMLRVFRFDVYTLLDINVILFFDSLCGDEVTCLSQNPFRTFSLVSTFVGNSIISGRVYEIFLSSVCHEISLIDLVKTCEFYEILGMN